VDDGPDYIALAIPLFFVFIGVEVWVARRRRRSVYHFADAMTDLACGVTQQVVVFFMAAALVAVYLYAYDHYRLITFADRSPFPWILAVVGVDLLYYWWHRLSHEVNFMWAVHVVHHSSEDFNLAVALRQAVLSDLGLTPFYLVLAFLGVTPLAVFTVRSVSTLYQFWIHTELVGKLGPLDRWVNTPSAHRVHHAINPRYLDRNYAAVFLVWDRLFGSYEPETEACVYGISQPLRSFNPLWAQTHYWVELWRIARKAPSLGQGLQVFFRSPGWHAPWMPTKPPSGPVSPETFVRYQTPARPGLNLYVGLQFALVAVATFSLLMWGEQMALGVAVAIAAWVLLSLLAWGALFEAKSWGRSAEAIRLIGAPLLSAGVLWGAALPVYWAAPAVAVAAVSWVWLARVAGDRKLIEQQA
jgi:alkylglycerol monooxygenase